MNATEIYYRIAYKDLADYGEDSQNWSNGLSTSEEPFVGMDGFTVPVDGIGKACYLTNSVQGTSHLIRSIRE